MNKCYENNILYRKIVAMRLLKILIKIYLMQFVVLLFFRILLMASVKISGHYPDNAEGAIIFESFILGWQFDTVIISYILSLFIVPAICLLYFAQDRLIMAIRFQTSLFTVVIFIMSADCAHYLFYHHRIDVSVLNWTNEAEFMLEMIIRDPLFLSMALLFVFVSFFYHYLIRRILRRDLQESTNRNKELLSLFLIIPLLIVGMRGRLAEKSPIRIGTAYFSTVPFFNHLALNPVFNFVRSALDGREHESLSLMPIDSAMRLIDESIYENNRAKTGTTAPETVVLLLAESFSADYMTRYGLFDQLTPFCDSLSSISVHFDRMYSSGIHTFNGVFSTLFSIPAVLEKHSMKSSSNKVFSSIFHIFKSEGYHCSYYTTHDDQFDNIAGVLMNNFCDSIISQKDYPSAEILSTLGVPDHVMYERIIKDIRQSSRKRLIVVLSGSNHPPFIFPKDISFKTGQTDDRLRMIAYSDWAMGEFFRSLKALSSEAKPLLFAMTGDHGTAMDHTFSVSMTYHHVPFIVYRSDLKASGFRNDLAMQSDIAPTLADFCGFSVDKIALGINLNRYAHREIYMSSDRNLILLNSDYLYLRRFPENGELFSYPNNQAVPLQQDTTIKILKRLSSAWLQASYHLNFEK